MGDSLLPSPVKPVEMTVFHGGGADMLESPAIEAPLVKFHGGGDEQINKLTFRDISINQLLKDTFIVKLQQKLKECVDKSLEGCLFTKDNPIFGFIIVKLHDGDINKVDRKEDPYLLNPDSELGLSPEIPIIRYYNNAEDDFFDTLFFYGESGNELEELTNDTYHLLFFTNTIEPKYPFSKLSLVDKDIDNNKVEDEGEGEGEGGLEGDLKSGDDEGELEDEEDEGELEDNKGELEGDKGELEDNKGELEGDKGEEEVEDKGDTDILLVEVNGLWIRDPTDPKIKDILFGSEFPKHFTKDEWTLLYKELLKEDPKRILSIMKKDLDKAYTDFWSKLNMDAATKYGNKYRSDLLFQYLKESSDTLKQYFKEEYDDAEEEEGTIEIPDETETKENINNEYDEYDEYTYERRRDVGVNGDGWEGEEEEVKEEEEEEEDKEEEEESKSKYGHLLETLLNLEKASKLRIKNKYEDPVPTEFYINRQKEIDLTKELETLEKTDILPSIEKSLLFSITIALSALKDTISLNKKATSDAKLAKEAFSEVEEGSTGEERIRFSKLKEAKNKTAKSLSMLHEEYDGMDAVYIDKLETLIKKTRSLQRKESQEGGYKKVSRKGKPTKKKSKSKSTSTKLSNRLKTKKKKQSA